MRVLHTIEGLGRKFGGIATCTHDLINAMQGNEAEVTLVTPQLKDHTDRLLGSGSTWLKCFPNDGIGPFNYSKNASEILRKSNADIFHINGLWQHICHVTALEARRQHKPYVITPHGMLYPEALRISYWKKWPMLKLWFEKDIINATALHATCKQEMQHLREFGYHGPIAIIGNPVKAPKCLAELTCVKNRQTTIGFLGRLHPRKKVEAIIRGLALAKHRNDVELIIMGSGAKDYEKFLINETSKLGLEKQVKFTGFITGDEKYRQLAILSALFVPSDMENFGMIVPEALLAATPVMASLGTPWHDLEEYKCGWWRDNSPISIAEIIDRVAEMSPTTLLEMGLRGRKLVFDKYETSRVAHQMMQLYCWLLGKSPKPDFVYLS